MSPNATTHSRKTIFKSSEACNFQPVAEPPLDTPNYLDVILFTLEQNRLYNSSNGMSPKQWSNSLIETSLNLWMITYYIVNKWSHFRGWIIKMLYWIVQILSNDDLQDKTKYIELATNGLNAMCRWDLIISTIKYQASLIILWTVNINDFEIYCTFVPIFITIPRCLFLNTRPNKPCQYYLSNNQNLQPISRLIMNSTELNN